MIRFERMTMTCDACGQRFVLVGARITERTSPTWRRVICEHADERHDGNVPTVTVNHGDNTETWSAHD